MSTAAITDIRLFSPFRKPDWRWRAAAGDAQEGLPGIWEDQDITRARFYFCDRERAVSDEQLATTYPDLFVAHAIHIAADVRRDELQARLLCEPVEIIAMKMGLSDSVVFAYAQIFFDVLQSLRARDWVQEFAIRPHTFSNPPAEGEVWRQLAYYIGPYALEALINDYFGRANPECPNQHELADDLRFLVRFNLSRPPPGLGADPQIVEESCQRELERSRRTGNAINPMLAHHLQVLRLAAGLRRSRELDRFLPKRGRRVATASLPAVAEYDGQLTNAASAWSSIRSALEKEILGPLCQIQNRALPVPKAKTEAEVPADPPSQSKLASPEAIVA
jgi:hypothetical protein